MNPLSHECQQQDVLLSVLYGEASDAETERFRSHLNECESCADSYNSFSTVRSAVRELRDEALLGFHPSTAVSLAQPRSARLALKAFFDLSPLWLKVGAACVTAILCVFGFLSLRQTGSPTISSRVTEPAGHTDKVYSEKELEEAVAKALAEQSSVTQQTAQQNETTSQKPIDNLNVNPSPSSSIKSRRPLSRNEREQLAADLRLVKRSDDDDLELLSDRINQ